MGNWITKKNTSKYIRKKEPKKNWITKKDSEDSTLEEINEKNKDSKWITIKDSKDSKLEEINDMLKDKTEDANKMFKMKTYKKGGLVTKGKPKLAKKGWK